MDELNSIQEDFFATNKILAWVYWYNWHSFSQKIEDEKIMDKELAFSHNSLTVSQTFVKISRHIETQNEI